MEGQSIGSLAPLVAALALAACSAPAPCAGGHDATCGDGAGDSGAVDLAVTDLTSELDGGSADSGSTEGGSSDGGRRDAGSTLDLGPVLVGAPCDPVRGCSGGLSCQSDIILPMQTVYDCADGGTGSVTATIAPGPLYPDGYCTNAAIGDPRAVEGAAGACDPTLASADPAMAGLDGCDPSARCVELTFAPPSPGSSPYVQCLARCPAPPGLCRAGYRCTKSGTCDPFGCESDLECRVSRDPSGMYCLDPSRTAATCNTSTGTCV